MLTVKTAKKDTIAVPESFLDKIGVEEGDSVNVRVDKGALIIMKEKDDFLSLEGALRDVDIKSPTKELEKQWKAWKPRKSL